MTYIHLVYWLETACSKRSYLSSIVQVRKVQSLASRDLNVAEDDGRTVGLALRG